MKSIVLYYSATGSTKKIAKAIHRGMEEVSQDCNILAIKDADPEEMARYDLIVIGGPIWFYREPANLRLFIYNMSDMTGKLCVPFCTHGASPAGFMFSMVPALTRKGLTIIGYNDWYGSVEQVLHAPKPYFTDGHPDEIDMKEAEEFGREMVDQAMKISAGKTDLIPDLPKGPGANPLWRPNPFTKPPASGSKDRKGPPVSPRAKWTINTEKCLYPECTTCADNCLVGCIDLTVTPPAIGKGCIGDALCERVCPVGAVEPDEESLKRRPYKVINMEKCDYPECTLCVDHCPMNSIDFSVNPPVFKLSCETDDLCLVICPKGAIEMPNVDTTHALMGAKKEDKDHPFVKMLEEAEAEGRFRRLIPMDKIGWDTPIYKIKKRPIFDIKEIED